MADTHIDVEKLERKLLNEEKAEIEGLEDVEEKLGTGIEEAKSAIEDIEAAFEEIREVMKLLNKSEQVTGRLGQGDTG